MLQIFLQPYASSFHAIFIETAVCITFSKKMVVDSGGVPMTKEMRSERHYESGLILI